MVIDATGVGRPVVDLFRRTFAWPLVAVTITGGGRVSWDGQGYPVPKADLVGSVQAAGGTGKLKYSPSLPFASVLDQELLNFRVKVTEAAHASYAVWREGQHDDLVLSVALALWWASRGTPGFFFIGGQESSRNRFLRGE